MIVLGTLFFFSPLGVERSVNFEIKFEELINADKSERNWTEGIYIVFRRIVISLTQFHGEAPTVSNYCNY